MLFADSGGGTLTPGRLVKHSGVPIGNLVLTMAGRMGAQAAEYLSDSTGRVKTV